MYKRRIIVFLVVITLVLVGLLARLLQVQIIRGDEYLVDAEQYLRRPEFLPAVRGKIVDRNGLILALDQPCYDLCLDYRLMTAGPGWIDDNAPARDPLWQPEAEWTADLLAAIREGRGCSPGQARRIFRDQMTSGKAGWTDAPPLPAAGERPLWRPAAKWLAGRLAAIEKQRRCTPAEAREIFRRRWRRTWRLAWQLAGRRGENLAAAVAEQVRRIRRMSHGGRKDIRELYERHPVVTGLDRASAMAAKADLADAPGVEIRASGLRHYPRGSDACHVIGLVGPVGRRRREELNRRLEGEDWLTRQRKMYRASDVIGQAGVEKMCEDILRGTRGYRVRRAGQIIHEAPAEPGGDVHLTLDIELQQALTAAFVEKSPGGTGAVVVLSVPRGQVLALVSVPTYDLNEYRRQFARLAGDTIYLPLRNRAVSQCYAPGSTVKPVAALSALAAKVLTVDTEFDCKDGRFGPNPDEGPKCWSKYGHGPLKLIKAICVSCNVYFDHVGDVMGPRQLTHWYRLFGLGQLPGTGLPEESAGIVASDQWMLRSPRHRRRMRPVDAWQMAIGQGPLSASPLQVANAMAAVARGGRFISPVLTLEGGPKRIRRDMPITDEQVKAVHEGMRRVVHDPEGTAHRALVRLGLNSLGFEFCGKTGTAQVPPQMIDSDGDGKLDQQVRWGDVAWFSGFAPYGRPQIAFAVMVEYVEGGAAANAGPIALEVVRICKEFGYTE